MLARRAQELGLSDKVELVHWKVSKDPHFREHWALYWQDGQVLDMTAVQVGGDPEPLRCINNYPPNFSNRRQYKIDTILGGIADMATQAEERYSRRQLLRVHLRMTCADLAQCISSRSLSGLVLAPIRLLQTSMLLFAGYVFEWALGRLSVSLNKLK